MPHNGEAYMIQDSLLHRITSESLSSDVLTSRLDLVNLASRSSSLCLQAPLHSQHKLIQQAPLVGIDRKSV